MRGSSELRPLFQGVRPVIKREILCFATTLLRLSTVSSFLAWEKALAEPGTREKYLGCLGLGGGAGAADESDTFAESAEPRSG